MYNVQKMYNALTFCLWGVSFLPSGFNSTSKQKIPLLITSLEAVTSLRLAFRRKKN